MKVHILQIPPEGKHYEGEDPNTVLDLHDENVKPVSPVRYDLNVGLSEGGLFATGEVGVDMQLQCVNCLEHFKQPIEVKDFATQVELTGAEMVDLTDPIREDILLALPAHPHCDWNGERVCPGAFHQEKETESPEDQSTEKRDVWGALDQLKLNQ
ncbi:YceD family protein [Verrucomicrobiota bacterium sgz303538]